MSTVLEQITNGMADALWVTAYASWIESIGGRREAQKRGLAVPGPGESWDDAAPDVPDEAIAAAQNLADAYVNDNGIELVELADRATILRITKNTSPIRRREIEQEQRLFGWYLAMMSMGTGTSWFDDHERFEIVVPSIEANFDGEFFEWSMGRIQKNPLGLPDPKDWPHGGYGVERNPPWKPEGVTPGGEYQTFYPDGRKSWAFASRADAKDWAREIGGTIEERGPAGYTHYSRNPSAELHDNWSASQVQSLLFDRDLFSATRAKEWAKSHGFKYGSIDTTDRYHHLRQFEPDGRACRTISFGESGIKAVVCAKSNPPLPKPPTVDELARAFQYIESEFTLKDGIVDGEMWAEGLAFSGTTEKHDFRNKPDEFQLEVARSARQQLTDDQWVGIAARANYLRAEQGMPPRKNPVGDHVDVTSGPGRGRSGVVESETAHVARVRFDRGGSAHLERSALRTKGRAR